MRTYNYTDKWQKLLTPEIVGLLTAIHEYKGEQTLFIETKPDVLTHCSKLQRCKAPRLPIKSKAFIPPMTESKK